VCVCEWCCLLHSIHSFSHHPHTHTLSLSPSHSHLPLIDHCINGASGCSKGLGKPRVHLQRITGYRANHRLSEPLRYMIDPIARHSLSLLMRYFNRYLDKRQVGQAQCAYDASRVAGWASGRGGSRLSTTAIASSRSIHPMAHTANPSYLICIVVIKHSALVIKSQINPLRTSYCITLPTREVVQTNININIINNININIVRSMQFLICLLPLHSTHRPPSCCSRWHCRVHTHLLVPIISLRLVTV
jgi:hypothetical protein